MKLEGIIKWMMTIQGFIGSGRVRENLNKPLLWKYVLVSKITIFILLQVMKKKESPKTHFIPTQQRAIKI